MADDDRVLLDRVRHGDRRAFDELYFRHAPAVLRYAARLTPQRADAEELAQETFVTFWAKRRSIELATASLLPWLLTTCRHHGANSSRRARIRDSDPLPSDLVRTDDQDARDELRVLIDAIDAMDEIDRAVCRRCLLDGLSYAAAASDLGLTADAVSKRLERARRYLRSLRATV